MTRPDEPPVKSGQDQIEDLDRKIKVLQEKQKPTIKDLITMTALTSQRDRLFNQFVLVPRVVQAVMDLKWNEALSEDGAVRKAIVHEVETAMDPLRVQLKNLEKKVDEKTTSVETSVPRKWVKVVQNERTRCIQDCEKNVVVFNHPVSPDETTRPDDEALRDLTMTIAKGEEIVSWKREAHGPAALRNWKGKSPPNITIRFRTKDSREKVVAAAKKEKKFLVQRDVPEILRDEFKELNEEGKRLREEKGCQTFVTFRGAEVILRTRRDEGDKWKTIKRL